MAIFFQIKHEFKSGIFDEKTFYPQFQKDSAGCQSELVIESLFITSRGLGMIEKPLYLNHAH